MHDDPKCPSCGYTWDPGDETLQDCKTYGGYEGGDEGKENIECPECEAELILVERVDRCWEVFDPEKFKG